MITSQLPPSRLLGSVATTISCPAFTCFVSTARSALVTARWETAVFSVSPTSDTDMTLRVRFGYQMKAKAGGGKILHDMVCSELDGIGEATSKPLQECLSRLVQKYRENDLISRVTIY